MSRTAPPAEQARMIEALVRDRAGIPDDESLGYQLLSGGNSHITWRIVRRDPTTDLVVKIAQPDGPLAPYDVGHEARMMDRAHAAGVPSPKMVGYLQDGDTQFLAMRRIEGDSPSLWEVRKWLEGRPDADRIETGRSLLATLPILARAGDPGRSQVEIYTAYIDELVGNLKVATEGLIGLPPTIAAVQGWLLERLPALEAPSALCHGDFRLGNAVFQDGRIVALLDWERAMVGHPLHDLGFLCLPGMKIGDHICGVFTQDEMAEVWLDLTGEPLDFKAVAWFKILAIFGELCLMVRAMARLAQGSGRLTGVRPLPLIARLHDDLIQSVRRWDNGDFGL